MKRGQKGKKKLDVFDALAEEIRNAKIPDKYGEIEVPDEIPKDPKEFIFNWARTIDPNWVEKGLRQPYNPFPVFKKGCHVCKGTGKEDGQICTLCGGDGYYNYLEILIDLWELPDNLLVPKSRQMMISWLFTALTLHRCMTREAQTAFFISKKEDDAGFGNPYLSLLSRAWHIWNGLPQKWRVIKGTQKHNCERKEKPPQLFFPEMKSSIMALHQDSDAIRQFTASVVLADEWAFQDNAVEGYRAMRPTLSSGGKLVGISTPNGKGNLFYRLVSDVKVG